MMAKPLELHDVTIIAENDHGWRFGVGRIGERWVGFGTESAAREQSRAAFDSEGLPVDPGYLHLFTEVGTATEMGVADRDEAIRLTGAAAQDPEACFGGIDRWFVAEDLRGDPEKYRCPDCDGIGGDCVCDEENDRDDGP